MEQRGQQVMTAMLLTQFSPVAVGLRVAAGFSGFVATFTCKPHLAGVTGQGLTCDPEERRDLRELNRK